MRSNNVQKSLLVAVQSVNGHICFTKTFLLKMGCEISGWRFLKVWFFYAGFYCIKYLLALFLLEQHLVWSKGPYRCSLEVAYESFEFHFAQSYDILVSTCLEYFSIQMVYPPW